MYNIEEGRYLCCFCGFGGDMVFINCDGERSDCWMHKVNRKDISKIDLLRLRLTWDNAKRSRILNKYIKGYKIGSY